MKTSRTQETILAHEKALSDYEEAKATETQTAWREKLESFSLEKEMGKV